MLQLFTLGELRLLADDGTLLSRRGKPLLLLTYLARRAPRQVARAELTSLLWGEHTEAKARHSLRQALLELHKLVGDRLVIAHDGARLETADIELDVERFERDVADGRDRDAVARWAGGFLPDADNRAEMALQLWLETERAGLRRRLTLAFERLLDNAERGGNTRDAITVARRWMELAPLDEHACERLIATLRRAGGGHAVEALAAHTQFTARVREALDDEPSRDFLRLAESLDDDARSAAPERGRSSLPGMIALPFVGRTSAFAKLDDAWHRAASGSAAVVVVMSEHGMGATRLGEELIRSAQRVNKLAVVLRADAGGPAPVPARAYSTASAMLQTLAAADTLGGIAPEMLAALAQIAPALHARFPHLPQALALPPQLELDAAVLAAAVRDAVEAAAEDAPVLLIVDTLSSADADSRALLLALTRTVRGAVLIVLIIRTGDAGDEMLSQLRESVTDLVMTTLRPLSVDDVAAMLDVAAPMVPDDRTAWAQAIHADTAGTPLYVTAAIQALLDERLLSAGDAEHASALARLGGRGLPVPVRVRADVRQQLHALDAIAHQVAEAAAVLGVPFSAADIAQLTVMSLSDAERGLASLEQAGLLRAAESGMRAPVQPPVVERAVYALIPPLRRESLHAAAASLSTRRPWYRVTTRGTRTEYHRERAGGTGVRPVRAPWAIPAAAALMLIAASVAYMWYSSRAVHTRDRTVAIFPFAVSGGSNVAYLRAGMADLLSTSLDGVGSFHTLDPRVVIAATNPDQVSGSLEPERARRIATGLGATYFVLGTVVGAGGQLDIGAALYDARRRGAPIARASAGGSEAALFSIVDKVTAQLAVAQGAQPGERFALLAAVTTTSLDALKAYLEGRSAYRANDLFAALPAFQRAVAADSSFALAWYGVATTASWMLNHRLEQHAAARAVREAGRLSARDRMLVEAFAAYSLGSADSAERMAMSVVESYDDIEGWVLLGEVLFHHNWKRGRSLTESRRSWERVLVLDPAYWPALQHLAEVAALQGRGAEADSLLGRYERSVGTPHMMLASRALRAYAYGNAASRASLAPYLAADRGFFLTASVWYVAVFGRDIGGAQALANMLVEPLRPPEQQGFGHILLAHLDLAQGRWRAARAELAIARVLTPSDAAEHELLLSMAPFLATTAVELTRQRMELQRLPAEPSIRSTMPWPRTHTGLHAMLRAYLVGMSSARANDAAGRAASLAELERLPDPTAPIALAKGFALSVHAEQWRQQLHPAEALAALERGARQTPFVPAWTSGFVSQAYERYARAELLHELGRDDEALRWYGSFGENSPYDLVYLAPALYRQAQIYDARGQKALAVERYRRFVELWKNCDPELQSLTSSARERIALLR